MKKRKPSNKREWAVKIRRVRGCQVIDIPAACRLGSGEFEMRREGRRLIIEPVKKRRSLLAWLKRLGPLEEDFPPMERLPVRDVKI